MNTPTQPYTVLARRFRPQTFDEVIGQQPVAQALKNAIKGDRVAHAYLFTGARGVGKTSMARILAKALNCPDVEDGVPCNQCDICRGIAAGQDVDVLEIDGASNRGIDDIRSLRAGVNVKSMRTKYKMYIIDEVHMLTREAFNALLKTLEEPPPNVVFVFCTTEPNKVPDTILSRCQRFDFATIETQNIMARLQEIAEVEGYRVSAEALELVARRANGSMRDSQSLFDQLLAFGEKEITADDVHRLLGTAGDDLLFQIVQALVERRREVALQTFQEALAGGVQLGELVDQLLNYLRDLMVLAAGAQTVPLLSVADSYRGALAGQAGSWGLQTIVAALEILAEAKTRMFRVSFARALAELALVRISLLEDLENISRLIKAVENAKGLPVLPPGTPPETVRRVQQVQSLAPAAPANSVTKPPAVENKSTPPVKKKLEISEKSPEKITPAAENPPPVQPPTVEFRPGNEKKILTQLIDSIKGTHQTTLKNVAEVAISGPNHLALGVPSGYHMAKEYCEKPEVKGQLEQILSQITGQKIKLTFHLVESAIPEEVQAKEKKGRVRSLAPDEPVDDEYVRQAADIFNATPVKVEEVPIQAKSTEDSAGEEQS